tara:strand:- start:562 stop:1500 length:939 start_codon:yes stop_codon:yes gene_type:complete
MRFIIFLLLLSGFLGAQPFAPAAGTIGTTAIAKDSALIDFWASECVVQRGYLDIAQKSLGLASHGDSSAALAYADGQVVSLGDSGMATYILSSPRADVPGADFAIFENSFSDSYLELAFVEVSSDGQRFVRFPAISLSPSLVQTGSFGSSDPRDLYNLAGKYRADFGVPFDLNELKDSTAVNIQAITHIRIVDVVGSIDSAFASFDKDGRIINDPYPTAFASGGFDLDALAFLKANTIGQKSYTISKGRAFPQPAHDYLRVEDASSLKILSLGGRAICESKGAQINFNLGAGLYLLEIELEGKLYREKIIIQ